MKTLKEFATFVYANFAIFGLYHAITCLERYRHLIKHAANPMEEIYGATLLMTSGIWLASIVISTILIAMMWMMRAESPVAITATTEEQILRALTQAKGAAHGHP